MTEVATIKEMNTVKDWCLITGSNRNRFYDELKSGRLKARKYGRRTIVLREDFEAWLKSFPPFEQEKG